MQKHFNIKTFIELKSSIFNDIEYLNDLSNFEYEKFIKEPLIMQRKGIIQESMFSYQMS